MKKSIIVKNTVLKSCIDKQSAINSLQFWNDELNKTPDSNFLKSKVQQKLDKINQYDEKINILLSAIESELNEVQKRSTVRNIEAIDIINILIEVDNYLNISQKSKIGTKITVNYHAQNFAKSYKYEPFATIFTAEFNKNGWNITNIYRDTCKNHKYNIQLSESAKVAFLNKAIHMD